MGKTFFEFGIFASLMVLIFISSISSNQDAWAEGGLRIVDQYAYPVPDARFEKNVDVTPVCTEQDDPNDRYTCAFTINRIRETQKAEEIADNLIGNKKEAESFSRLNYDIMPILDDKENCFEGINQSIKNSCEFIRIIRDEVHTELLIYDIASKVGQNSTSNLSIEHIGKQADPKIDDSVFSKFFQNFFAQLFLEYYQ